MKRREKIYTGVVLILGLFNFEVMVLDFVSMMPKYGNLEFYRLELVVFALYGLFLVTTSLINFIRKELHSITTAIQIIIFMFIPVSFFGWIFGIWGIWLFLKKMDDKVDANPDINNLKRSEVLGWTGIWILLLVPLYFVSQFLAIEIRMNFAVQYDWFKISKADPKILIADCRKMMAERDRFRNKAIENPDEYGTYKINLETEEGDKVSKYIPISILKLNPTYITIEEKEVRIAFHTRSRLLGFAEGANERGSKKLTDGLWYANGSGH